MKKFTLCLMTALLSLTFLPTQSSAAVTRKGAPTTTETAKIDSLQSRLGEIKAMDKSDMSSPIKKELRKESREIKSQVNHLSGGVYISAAGIIIILLIILILI